MASAIFANVISIYRPPDWHILLRPQKPSQVSILGSPQTRPFPAYLVQVNIITVTNLIKNRASLVHLRGKIINGFFTGHCV